MLRRIIERLIGREQKTYDPRRKASVLETAITFVINNNISGDYLEFGVFQGRSFVHAYKYFHSRLRKYIASRGEELSDYRRQVEKMRFFAFDSFAGLPDVDQGNLPLHWRGAAAMKCPKDGFSRNIAKAGVNLSDVRIVEGFFENSLTDVCRTSHQLTAGAVFHIDCDLYESTVQVLDFIAPLVQDGSVLTFDDWFYYRGHPERGERGAFGQWLKKIPSLWLPNSVNPIPPRPSSLIGSPDRAGAAPADSWPLESSPTGRPSGSRQRSPPGILSREDHVARVLVPEGRRLHKPATVQE
jgi:O-methyltransferase